MLSLPKNSHIFTAIKTAVNSGKDPDYMLFVPRSSKLSKISKHHINRLLLLAYQILKDETCQRCGIVAWHGRSTDNYVQFDEHESRCESCVVEGKSKAKDIPGVTRYLTASSIDPEEHPLPSRKAYHDQLIEDHRIEQARKAHEKQLQEAQG